MADLVLHCGGKHASLEEVAAVPTPEPEGRWHPIPHVHLVELVHDQLVTDGVKLVNEAHALNRNGAHYFGLFEIEAEPNADYATVIGLRNAHDKVYNAQLVLGNQVFVCDNLAFSGDVQVGRRHTINILRDLPLLVQAAIGKLFMMQRDQDKRISVYKETDISKTQADHLMVEMLRLGVVGCHQMPKLVNEWDKPSHEEFSQCGDTLWRLFNATTETLKTKRGLPVPKKTQALYGMMDLASGGIELEGDYEINIAA